MLNSKEYTINGFEKILEVQDEKVGLHAFIALHNTKLGPALGGVRIYPYKNKEDALSDVLRLSKGMTYKTALLEIGLGGGKSVIIADPSKDKSSRLLTAFAEAVNLLDGSYIAAEDVGSTTDDMLTLFQTTPYVSALPLPNSSGDPSPFTAWGIYRGMQATAEILFGSPSLKGKKVAIQGLGQTGSKLANRLFWEGAELYLTDTDEEKLEQIAKRYDAIKVHPLDIYDIECDIFSPCALGGILNPQTIPRLNCKAVAGSANNQLLTEHDGRALMERDILYAPDYVINAGGVINASLEFEPGGYHPSISRNKVSAIYDTLMIIFERAFKEGQPTNEIADHLAEYKLLHGVGKRKEPISFRFEPNSKCYTQGD